MPIYRRPHYARLAAAPITSAPPNGFAAPARVPGATRLPEDCLPSGPLCLTCKGAGYYSRRLATYVHQTSPTDHEFKEHTIA